MAQLTFVDGDVLTASQINTYLMGEGGAHTSWTPAIVQSGSVAATVTRATYARYGRLIVFSYSLAVTGTGSAATGITVSLPVTAAAAGGMIGNGYLSDSSASTFYPFALYVNSTTTCQLFRTAVETTSFTLGSSGFTDALASGDSITASGFYEAAS